MKILDIAKKAISIEAESILALRESLNESFEFSIKEIMKSSGKVVVTGMGKSGIIGKKIAATLASTGTPSFFMHPGEAFHGDLGMVEKQDIVIAISYSGETDELLKLIPFFNENGNRVIGMTGNSSSTLAKNSTFHIDASVRKEACPLELAPTSSTTAALVLGDAIAVSLMEMRDFKAENFARFHPGGSLGRRLLTKAKDLMRKEGLPLIQKETPLIDIIHAISNGRLGLAIITEDEKIYGIVTDGDLRRSLEANEGQSFGLTARDVMNTHPRCIAPDLNLDDIQREMKEKKISSLLVTANGELKDLLGVIQVYDIK